ncbi:MAG: hypothetical protein EB119_10505 [Synechococcaceae bacterium WBB_34_004]|nr:hypothetical protein [Synechococcaceae bacterium WBB_34_004]
MADKTITIQITGPAQIIDASMLAIVRNNGWTEGDPLTVDQKGREVVRAFLIQQAQQWNARQALLQAEQQTSEAVDATTMTLSVQAAQTNNA